MRIFFIQINLVLLCNCLFAQDSIVCHSSKAIVANSKFNVFYTGVENPLYISLEGQKSFVIKIDKGNLIERDGYYYVQIDEPGSCTIKLYNMKGREMGVFQFRVKKIPCPTVTIGGKLVVGAIDKNLLLVGPLITILMNFDFDVFYKLVSYKILITKINGETNPFSATGNYLSSEMKEAIQALSSGDKIMFYELETILANKNKDNTCTADPFTLSIK